MLRSAIRGGDFYAYRDAGGFRPVRVVAMPFGGFLAVNDVRTGKRVAGVKPSQLRYGVCKICAEGPAGATDCTQGDVRDEFDILLCRLHAGVL